MGHLYYFGNQSIYYNGEDIKINHSKALEDYAEAMKWFKKAAEQGNAQSQHNIGTFYSQGFGVQQNYAEALKWYFLAAQQGVVEAQFNLGVLYSAGLEDVTVNYAEAIKWFTTAAEQGYAAAQYKLGVMYLRGEQVMQNDTEAKRWIEKLPNKAIPKPYML